LTGPLLHMRHSTKAPAASSAGLNFSISSSTSDRAIVTSARHWSSLKAMSFDLTWRRQLQLSWKNRERPAPDRGGDTALRRPSMRTTCDSQVAKRRTRNSQVAVAAEAAFDRSIKPQHPDSPTGTSKGDWNRCDRVLVYGEKYLLS
jgi:hypothetical protein